MFISCSTCRQTKCWSDLSVVGGNSTGSSGSEVLTVAGGLYRLCWSARPRAPFYVQSHLLVASRERLSTRALHARWFAEHGFCGAESKGVRARTAVSSAANFTLTSVARWPRCLLRSRLRAVSFGSLLICKLDLRSSLYSEYALFKARVRHRRLSRQRAPRRPAARPRRSLRARRIRFLSPC